MSKSSQPENAKPSLRETIIGLGEHSIRKSYYPQLQQQMEEVKKSRSHLEEQSAALMKMLESLADTRTELADSQARYRTLVENINDVIFSLDTDGIVTYVSPVVQGLTGYSPEEIVEHPFHKFVHPDDKPALLARFGRTLVGQLEPSAFRIWNKDGTFRYVRTSSRPLVKEGRVTGLTGVMSDITANRQAEERIKKLANIHATLSHTNTTIVHAKNRDELFRGVCLGAVEHGNFILAWIGLLDEASYTARLVCLYGAEEGPPGNTDVSIDELPGLARAAIVENRVVCVNDLAADERTLPWNESTIEDRICGAAGLPLRFKGRVIGVLTLYVGEPEFFDADQLGLLEEMSVDISFALENFEREALRKRAEEEREIALNKLQTSLEGSILIAASITEMRDPYTSGHQRRVARLATAIAGEMSLSDDLVKGIHFGATIHDIGKIAIPAEILSKPSSLSDLEFSLIRAHPQAGHEILKDIEFPWPIAQIVMQHHERLDGSGYPQGLTGDAILLEARVIAVADVVEAISSHRPYRPALGIDAALEEIERFRNTRYDPKVVDACVALIRDHGYDFQQD
jgi:PAS domain S-box-containing protein